MKNLLVLFVVFSMVCLPVFGQYRVNKLNYNAGDYTRDAGDRYNPTLAGVASFFVPGLGQALSGETGRGLLFFAGSVVTSGITISSFSSTKKSILNGQVVEYEVKKSGSNVGAYLGLVASAGIWIWSIVDAVKVAKVNNLAYRDKNKVGLHNFSPVLIRNPNNGQLTGGLSFKLRLD